MRVQDDLNWTDAHEDVRDFVLRCLERDPKKRMTSAAALRHRWLDDAAPSAPRVTLPRHQSDSHLQRAKTECLKVECAREGQEQLANALKKVCF